MPDVPTRSHTVEARDGAHLFVCELGDPHASRTLVVVHGYGEHGGRYLDRMERFAAAGYRVLIPDVRGHGRSDGRRGHVMTFSTYVNDLRTVFQQVHTPAERTAIFGHSHGGLIVARYLTMGGNDVAAAALSSPLFGLAIKAPGWKVAAGRALSRVAPKASLPSEIKAEDVSSNPDTVRDYATDPLVHHVVNARWFTEAMLHIEAAFDGATAVSVPTLVMQAAEDRLVDAEASRRWADRCATASYERIDGAYHELLFERDGARHAERIAAFFDEHLADA